MHFHCGLSGKGLDPGPWHKSLSVLSLSWAKAVSNPFASINPFFYSLIACYFHVFSLFVWCIPCSYFNAKLLSPWFIAYNFLVMSSIARQWRIHQCFHTQVIWGLPQRLICLTHRKLNCLSVLCQILFPNLSTACFIGKILLEF